MERNEAIQKVIDIIKNFIKDGDLDKKLILTEKTNLFQDGLEFSSIDAVMFIVNLEEEFEILWPDELLSFDNSLTIGDVADIVVQCVGKKGI